MQSPSRMSASARKRKREIVALADILTNRSRGPTVLDGDGHAIMTVQSYLGERRKKKRRAVSGGERQGERR